jgi:hypothetical protein
MSLADVLRSDRLQPGWLMYLESTPTTRAWSGVGPLTLTAGSGPDTDGGAYLGLGLIVNMPSLKIPLGGSYSSHTFSISGVTQDILTMFSADRESLRGARLAWGRIELDAKGNPVAEPEWLWIGRVDSPVMTRDGTSNPPVRTIGLIAATGSVRRRVRSASYWTAPQQRAIDPNDAACDQVVHYSEGTDEIWP